MAPERLVDAATVAAGWAFCLTVSPLSTGPYRSGWHSLALLVVVTLATAVMLERRSLYEFSPRLPRIEETSRTATTVLGGAMCMALFGALADVRVGAKETILAVPLVTAALYVARAYLRAWLGRGRSSHEQAERIIVIGAGEEAREISELIEEHPASNFVLLGIVGDRAVAERHGLGGRWLGPPDDAVALMRQYGAHSAVVNATGFRGHRFRQLTREILAAGFDVRISTGITRLYCGRFDVKSLVHEPLISVEPQVVPAWQLGLKRAADVVGASLALLLALPVMALTALAIKLEDGGPVLFTQKRTGMGGEPFLMMKFRSMVPDAEARKRELEELNERSGPLFKLTRDPRITRVGKFIRETSIDELPQLLNVLRGDMSLVGPRPPLPEEQAVFDNELQGRFDVRPGITGLWQVEARSNASFNAYRRLDLHYVENWSFWMDLRILLTTAEQVLVAVATLPLRRVTGHAGADQVTTPAAQRTERAEAVVEIDLRDPAPAPQYAHTPAGFEGAVRSGVAPGD